MIYLTLQQNGMDGIQFSFGIGAFPFAMMGGVSSLQYMVYTVHGVYSTWCIQYRCIVYILYYYIHIFVCVFSCEFYE